MGKKIISAMLVFTVLLSFFACNNSNKAANSQEQSVTSDIPFASNTPSSSSSNILEPYADVRSIHWESKTIHLKPDEYKKEDIITYWYNEETFFEENEEYAQKIMDDGRNPGLNIAELHKKGITGENITIAIIDQPLLLDHPEYNGKIIKYHVVASADKNNPSSMHGPAVTSLAAGETIGTAPGVKIYYVAYASWDGDAAQGAEAIDWLIEQNKGLPEGEKIRAVSASVDFSNTEDFINTEDWESAVKRANLANIMVLDVRADYETCLFWPSYFDPDHRDDISLSRIGNPSGMFLEKPAQVLGTPAGYRTTAEYYVEPSYSYDAEGGRSWAVPYGVGVLALGWQVNPLLTGNEMAVLMTESAYVDDEGNKFLDPIAFIDAVKGTVSNKSIISKNDHQQALP